MPANFTIPLQTVIPGQLITAALWNGEFENIDTNFTPTGMDDHSSTDPQFQTQTDPFPGDVISRPTSMGGELERIRFVLAGITGKTYWYQDPDVTIATMKTNFDAHTHDGTTNNGPQIQTAGLADAAVTTVKIAAASVDENKIAASIAGDGLAGGAGTPLSVNVDDSTIEKSSDALRVKDSGITNAKIANSAVDGNKIADNSITQAKMADNSVGTAEIINANVTEAKLDSGVVNKLGQNIGLVALVQTTSTGNIVNFSGQGRLKGIVCDSGGSVSNFTITIDGVTVQFSGSLSSGEGVVWTKLDGSGHALQGSVDGTLASLDIHFKTSLVINKTSGTSRLNVAYERAA